jgi:hypothetical protein
MRKDYLNNRNLALAQSRFIESLEGIGDILVFETKRRKSKVVLQGLKRINKIIRDFLSIQSNNPDKFEHLLLSQDFFDIYSKDKKEAKLRLGLDPSKYLISFSSALSQILRIHKAAIEEKNSEISTFAIYHINYLLADIVQEPNNDYLVEYLLRVLSEATRVAVAHNDQSMHAASMHWYIDIVFNRLRQNNGRFDLSYLPLFEKHFFSSVRSIIYENQTPLFESLVSFLIDGILLPYGEGDIWEYGHLLLRTDFKKHKEIDKQFNIDNTIKELSKSENDLSTKEKLDNWLEKFDELRNILEPSLSTEQKREAKDKEEKIKDFIIARYKFNKLLEIVFSIGAYCLFKQKFNYLRFLWEYKQPLDSDASWVGEDIVPTTIPGVLTFYFRKGYFDNRFDFWEGHHGSATYYKEYFLLLLLRVLQSINRSGDKYEELENYNLPHMHVYCLSSIEYSIDNLISISGNIRKRIDSLGALGFDTDKLDELFDEKLIPFLKNLKTKAQDAIKNLHRNQNVSNKKVAEFRKQVLDGFKKSAILRSIFIHYNLYEDQTTKKLEKENPRLGVYELSEKAAFFDEWHVHYSGFGENYGRNIALRENVDIFKKIEDSCKEIKGFGVEQVLDSFKDLSSVIIFATHLDFYSFFESSGNFMGKWRKDVPQISINGFEGWYLYKGIFIPVFNTYSRKGENDKKLLIINKYKLGKLIQYSPIDERESAEFMNDIFYMNIQEFSVNIELMNSFLGNPPDWLIKIGDKEKQRQYLLEKVLITINERFEYIKEEEFEGYLMKITSEE